MRVSRGASRPGAASGALPADEEPEAPTLGAPTLGAEPLDARLKLQLEDLVATMCKALNDAKRLMLLYALRDRPLSVGELCHVLDVPQSNASQHLAVLRARGLVLTERRGNRVLYSLRYPALLDAVDILRSVMSEELDRQRRLHDLPLAAAR